MTTAVTNGQDLTDHSSHPYQLPPRSSTNTPSTTATTPGVGKVIGTDRAPTSAIKYECELAGQLKPRLRGARRPPDLTREERSQFAGMELGAADRRLANLGPAEAAGIHGEMWARDGEGKKEKKYIPP